MPHNNGNTSINLNSDDYSFSDEILTLAQCLMREPPSAAEIGKDAGD